MLKRFLFAMLVVCMGVNGYCQGKLSIDNVNAAHLHNSGTIMQNSQIKGYFLLYQSDRINKETNEYTLQILDQNVNKVIDIKFEDSRQLSLLEASCNTSSLAFLFKNNDNKTIDLKIYSNEGQLKYTYSRSFNKRSDQLMKKSQSQRAGHGTNQNMFDIGESGYASVYPVCSGKQISYEVDFYSSQAEKVWTYVPRTENEKNVSAQFLGSTDSLIILQVSNKDREKNAPRIVAINYVTKEKAFELDGEDDDLVLKPSNAINLKEQKKILLTGNYYNRHDTNSKGIAAYEVNGSGIVLSRKYNPWAGDIDIHKVVQSNGKFFLVGEANKGELVMMELDSDYKIIKPTVYHKKFNYNFTTRDADNFTVCFSDKEQTLNSIRYNGSKFVTDKIQLKSRANKVLVLPAKMGAVMIVEYFKKTKKLELRIERLG